MGLFDALAKALGAQDPDVLAVDQENVLWAEAALKKEGIRMSRKSIVSGKFMFKVPEGEGDRAVEALKDRGLW